MTAASNHQEGEGDDETIPSPVQSVKDDGIRDDSFHIDNLISQQLRDTEKQRQALSASSDKHSDNRNNVLEETSPRCDPESSLNALSTLTDYASWERRYRRLILDDRQNPESLLREGSELIKQIEADKSESDDGTPGKESDLQETCLSRYEELLAETRRVLSCRIRRLLKEKRNGRYYPSQEACGGFETCDEFLECCSGLLLACGPTEGGGANGKELVEELCRPVVERMAYHYLPDGEESDVPPQQIQEELLSYTRANIAGPLALLTRIPWNRLQNGTLLEIQDARDYFLKETVLSVRYIIRKHGLFSSKSPTVKNALYFQNGIEQLLFFDDFIQSQQQQRGLDDVHGQVKATPVIVVPRLLDYFISNKPSLLTQWMELEVAHVKNALQPLTKSTTTSTITTPDENKGDNIKNQFLLFPLDAELLCNSLHSLHIKCKSSHLQTTQTRFTNEVLTPLSMHFLQLKHSSSKSTLKKMTKLNMHQILTDLPSIIHGLADTLTGLHIASQSLTHFKLSQVAARFIDMRNSILEEASRFFLETALMEKAKWASYFMTLPFRLSSDEFKPARFDGIDDSFPSTLSCELREGLRMVAAIADTCQEVTDAARSFAAPSVEIGRLPTFGARALSSYLADGASAKFEEALRDFCFRGDDGAAVSVLGMERFHRDVSVVAEAFISDPCLFDKFRRVLDTSRLLILEESDFEALREVAVGLLLGVNDKEEGERLLEECRLDPQRDLIDLLEAAPDGVLDEFKSMLVAKGFLYVPLEEAWLLFNKKREY